VGAELIGVVRHDRDAAARSERAAGCEEAMLSQRGGDSDGGESEGRERENRGREAIDLDVGAIATHHASTFG
jgi:hypothetical protein